MRYLNKIVFINSANIPYAEVMLDGNVHFSGTQGVGKSTVLRALLFFYNADKMKLGIQPGQKSFEEFYLRYANSYIVYEVKTGHSAYSILVARSQGRAVFWFIDAPYRKEWLVDEEGHVDSDWIHIRGRIDSGVEVSPKIDTYELYRNIIFGNTRDSRHRYDKYALVESSRYQNIPRSIQNVFLNSKLDADFVKNTIIQSMTDSEECIKLAPYRSNVDEFEQKYNDIDCWYRKDANGEVVVRTKAQKVIDTYRLLLATEGTMTQTWRKLNFAVAYARGQMPVIEDDINSLLAQRTKIREKLESAQAEFQKEHDALMKKISTCDVRLGDIRQKRKEYDQMDIRAMLELDGQEPQWKAERAQKEQLLDTLQRQFQSVTDKYKALYEALDSEWKAFQLGQTEELQRLRNDIQDRKERALLQRDKNRQSIELGYTKFVEESDGRWKMLQEELNRTDKRLAELTHWHPMAKEMEACREEIRGMQAQQVELQSQIVIKGKDLEALRNKGLKEREEIERKFAQEMESVQTQLAQTEDCLKDTEEMLARWKGSLYEWLTENKPGWEENIGKVVDERDVLYAQGLNPRCCGEETSLFGISLDLEAIPTHHRTPDDYRREQKEMQKRLEELKRQRAELQTQRQQQLESSSRSYKSKIRNLEVEKSALRMDLDQMPLRIKDAETKLRSLSQQEEGMIAAEREKRQAAYNEALLNLNKEDESRRQRRAKRDKELKAAESEYRAVIQELQRQFDEFKQTQEAEAGKRKSAMDERRQQLQKQERDELVGKGADTQAIEHCRKEIDHAQKLLNRIEEQKRHVYAYRKDEEELFSHESEYREEKRRLEEMDSQACQRKEDRCKRYEGELGETSSLLKRKQEEQEKMKEGLTQYEQLCRVENTIPESFLQDDTQQTTLQGCGELVNEMRGIINRKRLKQEELKRATNSFNSHFGANNTFHFTTPQYDEEYRDFAQHLLDFIEDDRIEEYRKRVSEHYHTILNSISREVGQLMNHSAEIKAVINEVNRDFKERNFAGVIRSIELRAEESSDRLVLLLRNIRDFTEENMMNIGEVNLFSDADHGKVNDKVVEYLKHFMKQLQKEPGRTELTLSDTFRLQFRIQENDNNTGWVERISNVGSDGTDILVKAMVNIMLINVFKTKASRKNGDFIIHCMMDEIGKLHPSNVSGILQFANVRNIYLINSSPMGYNADIYRYNYLLTKDSKSQTHVRRLVTINRN